MGKNIETKCAEFRFYAELNDFLAPKKQYQDIRVVFSDRQTVKHLIESIGIPHTEVDLILVNGKPTTWQYLVHDGDRVSVYPVFESMDLKPISSLHPEPLRVIRFVLDSHLGRLSAYLRMLGFDALYSNEYCDQELAEISASQSRILLTRDRGLLKRSQVTHGYCLRSTDPRQQALEIIRRFDLWENKKPFYRCAACNGVIRSVPKESIDHLLLPDTRRYFNEFNQCLSCGRVYWKGSHYDRMMALIEWFGIRIKNNLSQSH
jgi:uncharacterized protein with PIN domain